MAFLPGLRNEPVHVAAALLSSRQVLAYRPVVVRQGVSVRHNLVTFPPEGMKLSNLRYAPRRRELPAPTSSVSCRYNSPIPATIVVWSALELVNDRTGLLALCDRPIALLDELLALLDDSIALRNGLIALSNGLIALSLRSSSSRSSVSCTSCLLESACRALTTARLRLPAGASSGSGHRGPGRSRPAHDLIGS